LGLLLPLPLVCAGIAALVSLACWRWFTLVGSGLAVLARPAATFPDLLFAKLILWSAGTRGAATLALATLGGVVMRGRMLAILATTLRRPLLRGRIASTLLLTSLLLSLLLLLSSLRLTALLLLAPLLTAPVLGLLTTLVLGRGCRVVLS
jgi:hypothetical protein